VNPLIIFTFLADPLQWLLEQMTKIFTGIAPLAAIGAFGVSVIVVTLVIRAVLFPIFNWQLRTSRRIQAEQRLIAPQLAELRKKYKKEPQKLSAEMNKLYREHGISPFSGLTGCLPALVQMPVLIGLYNGIRNATQHLSSTDRGFLWIHDVSRSAHDEIGNNWFNLLAHPTLLILPLIAAAFTFAQSRMMMPPPRPDLTAQERSMQNISRQMSILFPGMIFIFGLLLPQGLAIYWVTGTMFMVLQQYIVVGWGGLKVPDWWPGAHRTTPLSYPKALPSPALVSANGDKKRRIAASNGTERTSTAAAGDQQGTENEPATSGPVRRQHPSARARVRGNRGGQRRRRR
jgi:YidC/Oxa1 family membrane protein insertase